jgi:hypothetical protein
MKAAQNAGIVFVIILLMVQMWLLTATLESYLAGDRDAAFPGVVISALLFGGCFAIYRFVAGRDRRPGV